MGTVETWVDRVAAARAALITALDASAGHWEHRILVSENPAEAAWSPRIVAEHCVSSERLYDAFLDELVTAEAPRSFYDFATAIDWDWSTRSFNELAFTTVEAARAEVDAQGVREAARLRRLEAADLGRPALLLPAHLETLRERGLPPAHTIEGVLGAMTLHLEIHAEQLAEASRLT